MPLHVSRFASVPAQARTAFYFSKNREINDEEFDFFVENQKRDLRAFIDSQPAQARERTEELTLHILEIAVTKVVPVLIALI
jgi:DNA-binding transcriptional regulator YbjK